MSLNTVKGVFTAPTVNGQTSVVNLPAGFGAKAIIFFTAQATAEGVIDGNGLLGLGYGSRDGGAIQQAYKAFGSTDAVTSPDSRIGFNTTSVLRGFSDGAGTVDFEADLTAFEEESFTVTWNDAPASAIKVHYLALGGTDIERARVFKFDTVNAATQDVTVVAGFGQPDLLFASYRPSGALTESALVGLMTFAVAKSATERRCLHMMHSGGTSTFLNAIHESGFLNASTSTSGSTYSFVGDLADRAAWPVDGFRIAWSTPSANARPVVCLAIKGTLKAAIGNSSVPTAAAPQSQSFALTGGIPKAAILFTAATAAVAGVQTSGDDLGAFCIGATDGTSEGSVGMCHDDGAADAYTGRTHSESKILQPIVSNIGPPVIQSEADSALTASSLDLTWTDTDTVGRDYSYVILGQSAAQTISGGASTATAVAAGGAITAGVAQLTGGSSATTTDARGSALVPGPVALSGASTSCNTVAGGGAFSVGPVSLAGGSSTASLVGTGGTVTQVAFPTQGIVGGSSLSSFQSSGGTLFQPATQNLASGYAVMSFVASAGAAGLRGIRAGHQVMATPGSQSRPRAGRQEWRRPGTTGN